MYMHVRAWCVYVMCPGRTLNLPLRALGQVLVKQGFYQGPDSIPLEAARVESAGGAAGPGRIRVKALTMHPSMVCMCAASVLCKRRVEQQRRSAKLLLSLLQWIAKAFAIARPDQHALHLLKATPLLCRERAPCSIQLLYTPHTPNPLSVQLPSEAVEALFTLVPPTEEEAAKMAKQSTQHVGQRGGVEGWAARTKVAVSAGAVSAFAARIPCALP